MKLLHIISSVDPRSGGPIAAIRAWAPHMQGLGVEDEIVCLDPADGPAMDSDMPVHCLGTGRGYGYSAKLVPWLNGNLPRFDVALVHGLWNYASFGAWRGLHSSRIPYFVFPHGMLDPWFNRAYPLKYVKKMIYWRLAEWRVLRDASAAIFTCEEERRLARESFRPYQCREQVVCLGTEGPPAAGAEAAELFLRDYPHLSGRKILLFLGRLHPKKGADLLIQAFAQIARESAGALEDWDLVIAGPACSESYLLDLLRLATRAGCDVVGGRTDAGSALTEQPGSGAPRITFCPMLVGDEKWGALHACTAFVLPSHQENFGIAVAEALSCGKPVLISKQVNIWREIVDDSAGLADDDDVAGTVRLVRGFLALPEQDRLEMGHRAGRCFATRFEARNSAEALVKVIARASIVRDESCRGTC